MAVGVGDTAPDFTLKDQEGNDVTLSSFKGNKNVVLVFYPFTFTGVCHGEMCDIRDNPKSYMNDDTQVLALSCDTRHAQRVWAEQEGWTFPVLSDFWPHGAVAKAYGIFNEDLGCAMRGTFVIDKDGKVVDAFESGGLGEAREASSYEAALGKL
ncbi:MAG: peroxiredoxin [Actinobacteria bacterium]|nr:peroxiredoxin [Actinomycetota bacterium]